MLQIHIDVCGWYPDNLHETKKCDGGHQTEIQIQLWQGRRSIQLPCCTITEEGHNRLGLLDGHEVGLCKSSCHYSTKSYQEDYKTVSKQDPHTNGEILTTWGRRYQRNWTRQHPIFPRVDWNVEVANRNWKSGRDVRNVNPITIPSIAKRRTYGPSSAYLCLP